MKDFDLLAFEMDYFSWLYPEHLITNRNECITSELENGRFRNRLDCEAAKHVAMKMHERYQKEKQDEPT